MKKVLELLEALKRLDSEGKINLKRVIILQANHTIIATKREIKDCPPMKSNQ